MRLAVFLLLATCSAALEAAAPRINVLAVNLNPLIDRASHSPAQFAVDVPHVVSPSTAGEWSTSGGVSTWTYAAQIPGAVSMSFHATRARLPQGATLTVTADGVAYVYTAAELNGSQLWSRIGRGDSLTFELKVPSQDAARVQLDIASLQAGYRGFGADVRNHPHYDQIRTLSAGLEDSSCVENWQCDVTAANRGSGDATVALVIANTLQCSGVLLNNARGDDTPYILTARHCEGGNADGGSPGAAGSVDVYWNAVTACGLVPLGHIYDPGIPRQSGAQTVVEQQDAWLIRLNQPPIVDAYYAGWDATGAAIVGGFTPHHALGTSRQFLGWSGQAIYITKPVGSFENLHFASTLWGTVNGKGAGGGGSSGAGLFDESGRLVGVHVRGEHDTDDAGVCPLLPPPTPSETTITGLSTALSGIFNSTDDPVSTTGSVTLQSVLDPDHSGVQVLDGKRAAIKVSVNSYTLSVSTGTSVGLQWSSSPGAIACTASGGLSGDGWAGPLSTTSGAQQVINYDNQADVTYTVTCTDGQQRTGTGSATLHWVFSTPSISMETYGAVVYGLPIDLRWDSNVEPCTASGGVAGDGWGGVVPPKGGQLITETTVGLITYTLTCGSGTRVATYNFPLTMTAPYVFMRTDAVTLRVGQPLYINVISYGAPCTRSGGGPGDGWAGSQPPDSSSGIFSINESTPGTYTYSMSCGSGANVGTAQVTATFTNAAPTATIQANPATATINTDFVKLTWDSNVRPCYVSFDAPQGSGFDISVSGAPHEEENVQASVIGQYVYTVKCGSGANAAQASTTVNWTGTPSVTLSAGTQAIRGVAFGVGYFTNILPCTTSGGAAGDGWAGQQLTSAAYKDFYPIEQNAGDVTFTITCGSGAQTVAASRTVTVFGEGPHVTLTTDKEFQLKGQPITLTWSSNVGPCKFIYGWPGDGWTGNAPSLTGSATVTETSSGYHEYGISCAEGTVLMGSASLQVMFSDFPPPTLTASKTQALVGDAITINWASADGAACVAQGGVQGDGWAGDKPASGSMEIKESTTGDTYFLISCGQSPLINMKVKFYRVPTATLKSGQSTATVDNYFTLQWSSTDADSCTADGGNQADGWSGQLVNAAYGFLQIHETSTGTYTYAINCVGTANTTASANATVTVNPAPTPPPPPPSNNGGTSSGGGGGGGGGGGAMGPIDLGFSVAFGLLAWHRRRAREQSNGQYGSVYETQGGASPPETVCPPIFASSRRSLLSKPPGD